MLSKARREELRGAFQEHRKLGWRDGLELLDGLDAMEREWAEAKAHLGAITTTGRLADYDAAQAWLDAHKGGG